MDIQNKGFLSIQQVSDTYLNRPSQNNKVQPEQSFKDVLKAKENISSELKFSKHAANRLSSRNIELTGSQMDRLKLGTQKASEKGIKETLVLVDSLAFIVNVPSNTVVTAMNQNETEENIFTNIDGAVIM